MKARRLPSGSWNCLVFNGYKMVNGKKKRDYKSITTNTKNECEKLALDYSAKKDRIKRGRVTVGEAIDFYIQRKEHVLSPSTATMYKSLRKTRYDDIKDIDISALRKPQVQMWIDEMSLTHSPKTVRNAWGLLSSSLADYDITFRVSLPEKKKPNFYLPSDGDIKSLLEGIKGTELEKAVLLASLCTLRRGEICALTYKDIEGKTLHVRHAVAWNGERYVLKSPKTSFSERSIEMPSVLFKLLRKRNSKPDEKIVDMTPNEITRKFERAVANYCKVPFRFHDLRAYSASIRHSLNIPNFYVREAGGWHTDSIMERAYIRSVEEKKKEFAKTVNDYFDRTFK